MGIVPRAGQPEVATGSNFRALYHGGSVMRNVTLHTVFWAPNGFRFNGPPSSSSSGYEELIQRFLTDVSHDSGQTSNVFSVLPQYGDGSGPGQYRINYDRSINSINDSNPFPSQRQQCASPSGIATCVTDLQLQHELDGIIESHDRGARGLGNLWLVFLPPNVDTCISPRACGTNVFGGYHGLSNLGHGVTIYANIVDPIVETNTPPGSDPQGNPDAETAIDVAAEETVEAMSDPLGTGWIDPNGNEIVDKCDSGPQQGTPLGFAPNGSPFDQLINGEPFLLQLMWSNAALGCVQRSAVANTSLPVHQVNLTQFSSAVSGSLGQARPGVRVRVTVLRTGVPVAQATALTTADGRWGPALLRSRTPRTRHAVGDDRDEIDVAYSSGLPPDVILTGNGGNAFAEAGWTGWAGLDNGYAVATNRARGVILLSPCSQTGSLGLRINRVAVESPVNFCGTETDVSIVKTRALSAGASIAMSSNDNRAVSVANPHGALVRLLIPLGEPNSVSAVGNPRVLFNPSGFPSCTADLQAARVSCSGLVPGATYTLTRQRGQSTIRATAGTGGKLHAKGFRGSPALAGGDNVRLRNPAERTLTDLHVAHLRVNISGASTVIASGRCEPGDYYGRPLTTPPVSAGVGADGVAGTGTICPVSGNAAGLSSRDIEQSDDLSGGQSLTHVPDIENTSPTQGETVYGSFIALATAGLPAPHNTVASSRARIAVTIVRSRDGRIVFHASNVNTATGATVRDLAPAAYRATWILTDANGDTRTIKTRFQASQVPST